MTHTDSAKWILSPTENIIYGNQVDIMTKPSHYQLVSGSNLKDSSMFMQMAENEEEGSGGGAGSSGHGEEGPPANTKAVNRKTAWPASLGTSAPQPSKSTSAVAFQTQMQSGWALDITSDECGSPRLPKPQPAPQHPEPHGAPSPSAHMNLSAPPEGRALLRPEDAEAEYEVE